MLISFLNGKGTYNIFTVTGRAPAIEKAKEESVMMLRITHSVREKICFKSETVQL